MAMTTQEINRSRGLGTSAFKKEINHLLYSQGHTGSEHEYDPGWNCRDHALVMALSLKRNNIYPKVATGKCMFVQGPYSGNAAFGIGQETHYTSGHSWVVDPKFGLIDVSPLLKVKQHCFRVPFNGIFGRVWLPKGKENTKVVVCDNPDDFDREINKASHATALSTAVYMHLDDLEVTDKLVRSPFKFLHSGFSAEIKKRFGAEFYPAVEHHLHDFMLGKRDSLITFGQLKARNAVMETSSG